MVQQGRRSSPPQCSWSQVHPTSARTYRHDPPPVTPWPACNIQHPEVKVVTGWAYTLVENPHKNFKRKTREDDIDHCPGLQRTYRLVNEEPESLYLDTTEHKVSNELRDKWVSPRGCPERENDKNCCSLTKKINYTWTTHDTSSQIHVKGNEPFPQSPMHSRTRNEILYGPQMAISSLHSNLREGTPFLQSGGSPKSGESRRHQNSVVNVQCSYTNIGLKDILTNASVTVQRGSMNSYPPSVIPKAPDKRDCRIVDDQSVEVILHPKWEWWMVLKTICWINEMCICVNGHHVTHVTQHVMQHVNSCREGRNGVHGSHTFHTT